MKIVKRILSVLLCLVFAGTCFMTFSQIGRANWSGENSSVTTLTAADRMWILDHFGDCADIECLILCVDKYAVENFHYDYNKIPIFQHFDFEELITRKSGICFDFSCFAKCCFVVWAEYNDVELKAFVVDVKYKKKSFLAFGHSYNVVQMPDGKNYYCDITSDIYKVQKEGKQPFYFETFTESIKDYAARYDEFLVGLH